MTRYEKIKLSRANGKTNQIMTKRQLSMVAIIPIKGAPRTNAKVEDATIHPTALPFRGVELADK